jgi:hypothetical protein
VIYTLQSHEAIARWDELVPLLETLPEDLTTPHSHIKDMVEKKEAQVWCLGTPIECLLITKVENSFEKRYGVMLIAAGDMRVMEQISPVAENWFREMGCTHACFVGRRGWKKVLKDYTEQTIQMVKKL